MEEICFLKVPFSPTIGGRRPVGNLIGLFRLGNKNVPEGLFQQLVRSYSAQHRAFIQCNPDQELYDSWAEAIGKRMYEQIEAFAIERGETIEAAYDVISLAIYCRPNHTRTPAQQAQYETVHCLIFKDMIYRAIKSKLQACCRRKNKAVLRVYAAKRQQTS